MTPQTIKLTKRKIFIDLAAEKLLVAEKDKQKIAVEVKIFIGLSLLTDFYGALGQYQVYFLALKHKYPDGGYIWHYPMKHIKCCEVMIY